MSAVRASSHTLKGLKNISWLTARQLDQLSKALTVSIVEKRETIFDENHLPDSVYILLSGVARITSRNRKGQHTLVVIVAPGMVPSFPPSVSGISYDFRCEAVTRCRTGTIALDSFVEISLGIGSADFKRMAAAYLGRWNFVQLRCPNFLSCSLGARVALVLLELSETFGVPDAKGTRLALPIRHLDLAELVGASRPRVTEYMTSFERDRLVSRNGRELVVKPDRLVSFLAKAHVF